VKELAYACLALLFDGVRGDIFICVEEEVYPILLGSLQYAAACSRPDISTALNSMGYVQSAPSELHLQALKNVLRYLKGTM
jgi:hypothetical protein